MALMLRVAFIDTRLILRALCVTVIAAGLAACETVTTAPPTAHLDGSWQLDRGLSDNPDAKIATAMTAAESKLRKALSRYSYSEQNATPPGSSADNSPDAPDYSYDSPGDRFGGPGRVGPDFRGLKARLRQALTPPAELKLEVQGDLVTITADQLPPRDYRLDERISRFDEYGTAIITTTWTHDEFVVSSRYTSRASRSDSYQVDQATGLLSLTQLFIDPTVGKITIRSVYRRS